MQPVKPMLTPDLKVAGVRSSMPPTNTSGSTLSEDRRPLEVPVVGLKNERRNYDQKSTNLVSVCHTIVIPAHTFINLCILISSAMAQF